MGLPNVLGDWLPTHGIQLGEVMSKVSPFSKYLRFIHIPTKIGEYKPRVRLYGASEVCPRPKASSIQVAFVMVVLARQVKNISAPLRE